MDFLRVLVFSPIKKEKKKKKKKKKSAFYFKDFIVDIFWPWFLTRFNFAWYIYVLE